MEKICISEDIFLRKLELSDAPEVFRIIDTERAYLGRWLPFVESTIEESDSLAFIQSLMSEAAGHRELVYAIMVREELAGIIGFKDTDKENRRTEIGYWLSESYQGQGIMTASADALCRMAFREGGIHRIQIKCAVGNTKSSNIPRRLGFSFEGIERDGERQANGKYWDVEVYSLLEDEYKPQEPAA